MTLEMLDRIAEVGLVVTMAILMAAALVVPVAACIWPVRDR